MSETTDELTPQEQEYFVTRGENGFPETEATDGIESIAGFEDQQNTDRDIRCSRTVPHGALHAEREEHKKTRAELQQLRAKATRMQQEFQAAMAAVYDKAEEAGRDIPPDPREDFLGFTRWQVDEINRLKSQVAENKRREDEARQVAEAEQALWNEWNRSVELERTEHNDLDDALNFLAEARNRQLGILGQVDSRFCDPGFRESQMRAELRDIVVTTFQQGKNPAKTVYEIAKAYGYGGEPGARFMQLNNAQSASRTLTSTAGKAAGDPMLLETVANLSEAEFAKWYENNRNTFRKMFGG